MNRPLGNSGVVISPVALGTMSWPGCNYAQSGHATAAADLDLTLRMTAAALDAGSTTFDTAEGYGLGLAETFLGMALEKLGRRDEAQIVTKTGPLFGEERAGGRTCNLSASHIIARCEKSLERLRTDRIDLYLAHWPDSETPVEETLSAVETLREQGKIRAFGVSNFSNDQVAEALRHGAVAANQLPYSLVDREIEAGKQTFCVEQNIGILAYSPLGKGVLSGKYDASRLPPSDDYRHQRKHFAAGNFARNFAIASKVQEMAVLTGCSPSQLALAWLLAQPGVAMVLPGAKSPEQAAANAMAANVKVPEEILLQLSECSLTEDRNPVPAIPDPSQRGRAS